jgi:hypothetical protein
MKALPIKLRQQIANEIVTARCARYGDGYCSGRKTVEHAFGRVRQERWQLLFLCRHHHLGDGMDKQKNKWLALNQATEEDFNKYPKSAVQWRQEKAYLNSLYGEPALLSLNGCAHRVRNRGTE